MVEETIKTIKETENEAEEIVRKADAECTGILEEASAKAKEIKEQAEADAKAKAEASLKAAKEIGKSRRWRLWPMWRRKLHLLGRLRWRRKKRRYLP